MQQSPAEMVDARVLESAPTVCRIRVLKFVSEADAEAYRRGHPGATPVEVRYEDVPFPRGEEIGDLCYIHHPDEVAFPPDAASGNPAKPPAASSCPGGCVLQ